MVISLATATAAAAGDVTFDVFWATSQVQVFILEGYPLEIFLVLHDVILPTLTVKQAVREVRG